MKRLGWLLVLVISLLAAAPLTASAKLAWDNREFMGIGELLPGMKGYGKTVYEGTTVEKFDIEVVGVLRKVDFGFDMILIKVTSGPVVDRKLQTVSGMSGSPIYVDGRLIGAYAYGWDFQQEAIAGVTPIASMLECTEPGSVEPPLVGSLVPDHGVVKIGDKLIARVKVAANHTDAAVEQAKADPTTMVLAPVATPVFVSGMNERALKPLQKLFDRYNLQAMAGPGQVSGPAPALEPGSAVAVSLAEGDINIAPVGTVTYVKGDTVLCFGHPFMQRGTISMPLAPAYVHGVINSAQSSFKLASPMASVGVATSDRQFALAGELGKSAEMVPVSLYLKDDSRAFVKRYSLSMVSDPELTPYLLYAYILTSGAGQMGDLRSGQGTFTADTVISTDKYGDIRQHMVVAPEAGGPGLPMGDLYTLTNLLMQNPYEPVKINKVFVDLGYAPERNIATIEKVTPDRPVARPGETVTLRVRIRPYGKPVEYRTVTLKVPETAAEPVMAAVVTGGTNNPLLKGLITSAPTAEEGVPGLVRWLTDNPSAQTMVTAQLFPTPSYGYRGRVLRDIPSPVVDLLRFDEMGSVMGAGSMDMGGRGNGVASGPGGAGAGMGSDPWSRQNLHPTAYLFSQDVPYVLLGGQTVMIAIQTEEQAVQNFNGALDFGFAVPVLSSSPASNAGPHGAGSPPADGGDDASEANANGSIARLTWLTAQQKMQYQWLQECFGAEVAAGQPMSLPSFMVTGMRASMPLSWDLGHAAPRGGSVDVTPVNDPGGAADTTGKQDADAADDDADASDATDDTDTSSDVDTDAVLLTAKEQAWGMKERGDFLRGKHLGTAVTSKGELTLAPAVSTVANISRLVPWKMVSTKSGTYVAGWGDAMVLRLAAKAGDAPVSFWPAKPADAQDAMTATSLAADADGNLLIGTWPDQKVRLVKADGSVMRTWSLPGTVIWDLAVATNGMIYAGCDDGKVYELRTAGTSPVGVAATLPDKHIYAMAAGPRGTVYMATAPRGKVYRINEQGVLESVFEGEGAVSSLLVDLDGNLFIGMTPECHIMRVGKDGLQKVIMRGVGMHENHVLAMKMFGGDLYAATGPGGGIYRIANPLSDDPAITTIFARQDRRNGLDEAGSVGPESVMVNALTVTPQGELLAAASSPGQVLRIEPRTEGAFLSSVLHAPSVVRWGQVEYAATTAGNDAVVLESRSGKTALPDRTWSDWTPVRNGGEALTSEPAPFVQLRVRLKGSEATSPSLDYLKVRYESANHAPVVKVSQPEVGDYWHGEQEISWVAKDPDGDKLVYTVFASADGGKTWKQLSVKAEADEDTATKASDTKAGDAKATGSKATETKATDTKPAEKPKADAKETHTTSISWDTKAEADGTYRIKVVASDKYARPADAKTAEVISGAFTVDNSAPKIEIGEWVPTWDAVKRLEVTDTLTAIRGGRYRLDDGPWIALVAEDGIFNSPKEVVLLLSPDGPVVLGPGNHKVTLQVKDAAGNALDLVVNIGEKPAAQPTGTNATAPAASTPPAQNSTPAVPVPGVNRASAEDSKGLADLFFGSLNSPKK